MDFVVETFYKFTPIDDLDALRSTLLTHMDQSNIKGTIILAPEGVNGTFCGEENVVSLLVRWLLHYPGLSNTQFKRSYCPFNPFDKAKVKLRKEIVTFGLEELDLTKTNGEYVSPELWNQLIEDQDTLVIDTRNDYEVKLGTFKNAINPKTLNFRDFPTFVETQLEKNKHKKIAMFCTGGVRCEKSTAYLKNKGFEKVYQLDGGILNYLAATPPNESLWQGHCFVFDNRIALDAHLKSLPPEEVDREWKNKNRVATLSNSL